MARSSRFTRRRFMQSAALAGAGLSLVGLGACGTPAAAPAAAPAAEGEESQELLFWAWDEPISELMKKGYEAKFPGYIANPEIVADYENTFYTSLVAGAGLPDCAWIDSNYYQKFARTGQLMELDDFLAPYKDDILPFLWDGGLVDGKQYGAPRRYAPEVLWYRKDRFEEAGVDPNEVKTWEDFITLGAKLTDDAHHMTPFTTIGSLDYNLQALIFSKEGTGFFDADDNVVVNSEKNVNCLETWLRLVKSGVARDMELWSPAWYDAAAKGDIACLIMPYWYGSEPRVQMPDTAGKWDILRVPSIESGVENASIWQGAMYWIIPAKSAQPELAWKFIEYTNYAYDDAYMQESMDREFVLPAYTKFMEGDYFWQDAMTFFGTDLRQRANDLTQGAPVNYMPPEYTECEKALMAEMIKLVAGDQTAQQTLDNAALQFEDLLKARV